MKKAEKKVAEKKTFLQELEALQKKHGMNNVTIVFDDDELTKKILSAIKSQPMVVNFAP